MDIFVARQPIFNKKMRLLHMNFYLEMDKIISITMLMAMKQL
ncbi:hypothetical protein B0H69_002357 [Clostridium beijerinckii]|nr:hypothetical protein [Clostridium beijerinckii]NYC08147.1 hypothetical protein [Clostridium beijerinckii]